MILGTKLKEIINASALESERISRMQKERERQIEENQKRQRYEILQKYFSQAIASITKDILGHNQAPLPVPLGREYTDTERVGQILRIAAWGVEPTIESPEHPHHEHWAEFAKWAESSGLRVSLHPERYATDDFYVIKAEPA